MIGELVDKLNQTSEVGIYNLTTDRITEIPLAEKFGHFEKSIIYRESNTTWVSLPEFTVVPKQSSQMIVGSSVANF